MATKSFQKNGNEYFPAQYFGWAGMQWKCKYPDGQESWAMVYKSNPTRQNIIDAIDEINELSAKD